MKRWLLNLQDRLTRDRFMRRLWRDVRRQGWSSVSSWDDAEVQYWEYTVGFDESLNQPEIAVGGLPPYRGRQAFASIHAALRYGSLQLEDGVRWGPHGTDLYVLREFHPTRITPDWLAIAMYRRQARGLDPHELRAFQLVLPDEAGLLPWEAGHDEAQRLRTPELWRPPQQQGCGERRPMRRHARQSGR